MNARASISVVLCTFNGARYLPALLHSLAEQTMPIDRIVLRDDGSTDGSVELVRAWAVGAGATLHRVAAPEGRLGPAKSFLAAIVDSPPAECHLLADQDDVWLADKVERAFAGLRGHDNAPALYASRLEIVDEQLMPIGVSARPTRLSVSSAVCESLLTGCTMAFNEPLRQLISRGKPTVLAMHDWWLYLLASATGSVVFDDRPTVLYRQHAQNVVGATPTGPIAWVARARRALGGPGGLRGAQLREFDRIYGDLIPSTTRALVRNLADRDPRWWARCRSALILPIARQTWLEEVGTRLAIMRGRF